jgi:hypothetical protein
MMHGVSLRDYVHPAQAVSCTEPLCAARPAHPTLTPGSAAECAPTVLSDLPAVGAV